MFLAIEDVIGWIIPIVLGLAIGMWIASKRGSNTQDQLIYLEAEEFRANMRKGQLIDIRSADDYNKEKILGSRNFPKKEVFGNLFKLRTDQAVFIYDEMNSARAKSVAKKLIRKGYHPVYVLQGGFANWPFIKK